MSGALQVCLYISAGFLAFGALATVARVGKPREPLSATDAVLTVIVTAAIVVFMFQAALR
jgi:hypothetical protein